MKWCVTLGNDGWSCFLSPYRGEENIANTDTYQDFRTAKKACLEELRYHLLEVKKTINEVKRKKAKSGGWALD